MTLADYTTSELRAEIIRRLDNGLERVDGGDPHDRFVDEVVLHAVDIHLERMHDGLIWVGVDRRDEPGMWGDTSLHLNLWAVRKNEIAIGANWSGPPWPNVTLKGTPWDRPHPSTRG